MSLIIGDDGLPADEVGKWVKKKHDYLRRYLDISCGTRGKFIGDRKGGAVYFDLFCGCGRSKIRDSAEWVDGGAIAAWKASQERGAPFTEMYVSEIDEERLNACTTRLQKLGAPVYPIHATAVEAAEKMVSAVSGYGLHFAFVDPYSLGALDFQIISSLSKLKRIDLLIHLSVMDLQRNMSINLSANDSAFDAFAPGWRSEVSTVASKQELRRQVVDFWRRKVSSSGVWPSLDQRLISGEKNQPLYWLLLAARHDLAHKFWATASNPEGQKTLMF